jgi:hypothetical protein
MISKYGEIVDTSNGILSALHESRIFNVTFEDGFAVFEDSCDNHFWAELNKSEMVMLIEELKELIEVTK